MVAFEDIATQLCFNTTINYLRYYRVGPAAERLMQAV